ncbi:hypothetical protein BKA70DRAFT_1290805 [Coprinopsis sp. MPI-PUGE-AT-0042]|nr:hypothetical protein BKA70DRAFT_1290805 [Coprinopsis sp. MPI-PUGE-AT-0042]
MSPHTILIIPREIAFEIVDNLEDDPASLKNTSLVCKAWQYHSQRHLFRTFTFAVNPQDRTVRLLEELGSESSARIRGYIEGLFLAFLPRFLHPTQTWLLNHGELLAQVLKMLLGKLTCFTLECGWIPFFVSRDDDPIHPSLAILRCIEDICASPKLTTLTVIRSCPWANLLSRCGPSLKNLYTSHLCKSDRSQVALYQGRGAPIELEALVLQHLSESLDEEDEEGVGLDDYILDPRSFINLASLTGLQVEGDGVFNANLSQMFSLCMDSLHWILIDATVVPSRDYMLGFRRASCLKNIYLSFRGLLAPAKLTRVIKWLLRELTEQHQLATHQDGCGTNHPSQLERLDLSLPFSHVTDLKTMTVSAFSEVLSDKTHFPLLKNVDIKFTYTLDSAFDVAKSGPKEMEEIEAAMRSLQQRGGLRVEWEGVYRY